MGGRAQGDRRDDWAVLSELAGRRSGRTGAGGRLSVQAKALASRLCRRSRDYAFNVLHAPQVYSIIRNTNTASQNVAKRNGMTLTSRFTKHYRGVDMPHLVYSVEIPIRPTKHKR